jgi:hypothetical protein
MGKLLFVAWTPRANASRTRSFPVEIDHIGGFFGQLLWLTEPIETTGVSYFGTSMVKMRRIDSQK